MRLIFKTMATKSLLELRKIQDKRYVFYNPSTNAHRRYCPSKALEICSQRLESSNDYIYEYYKNVGW